MAFPDDHVPLSVPNPFAGRDHGRSHINGDLIGDAPSAVSPGMIN